MQKIVETLEKWVNINSFSFHREGILKMCAALEESFSCFPFPMQRIELAPFAKKPLGVVFNQCKKIPNTPSVLLVGHMDTVFPPTSPFQKATFLTKKEALMQGPGALDMKGGIAVMLEALRQFEQSPFSQKLSWEVWITSDEEIGSPSSKEPLKERAKHHTAALVFEPAFPDGAIVASRRGSLNFHIEAQGKAAHAGRDFAKGRNAIMALSEALLEIEKIKDPCTINMGTIEGGIASNIVAPYAKAYGNIRTDVLTLFTTIEKKIETILRNVADQRGVALTFSVDTLRYPRLFDEKSRELFLLLQELKKEPLNIRDSGGASDANTLAECHLPLLDGLGPRGEGLHTEEEYVVLKSIEEQSRLIAELLERLAK